MGVDVYKCLRIKYTGRCIATPRTDGGVKMEMHGSGRYRRNPAVSTLSAEIYGSAGVGRGGVNILAECAIYRSYAERKSAIYFLRSECSSVSLPPLVRSFNRALVPLFENLPCLSTACNSEESIVTSLMCVSVERTSRGPVKIASNPERKFSRSDSKRWRTNSF